MKKLTQKELKLQKEEMTKIINSSIYQKHTTECSDEIGNIGSFYFDGIYPTNYKRTSPTFKDLIDLFNWRNEQIGIKFLENGKMIIENKEVI